MHSLAFIKDAVRKIIEMIELLQKDILEVKEEIQKLKKGK